MTAALDTIGQQFLYRAWVNCDGVQIDKLPVMRRTPKGCWVRESPTWVDARLRFVLESSKQWTKRTMAYKETPTLKRFAWPTEDEAVVSLVARTRKRIEHLGRQLAQAKDEIPIAEAEMLKRGLEVPEFEDEDEYAE